jgi:exonuclease III
VNILCIQEMKWKGQKAKEVEDTGFKLWYTGNTSRKNGVGIVLDKSLKDGVVDIKRKGDMIILVKLFVGDLIFNVISAYAPQIGLNKSVKMQFWEELDALFSSVPISEKLFIGGDLNGHVGSTRVGFDGFMGVSGMRVGTKKGRVS